MQGFHALEVYHFAEKGKADAAIISSVVELPERFIQELSGKVKKVLIFSPALKLPLQNMYKTPETLGNDRISAAVGAHKLYPGKNLLVIDAGTCVKYDFVNASGQYIGGAISPGLRMRLEGLHRFTGRLPLLELEQQEALTGQDTKTSIMSGVVNGCAAEIDGIIGRYRQQYSDLTVILTGGDANFLEGKLKNSIFVSPNIVLLGLNEILNYNVS